VQLIAAPRNATATGRDIYNTVRADECPDTIAGGKTRTVTQ